MKSVPAILAISAIASAETEYKCTSLGPYAAEQKYGPRFLKGALLPSSTVWWTRKFVTFWGGKGEDPELFD